MIQRSSVYAPSLLEYSVSMPQMRCRTHLEFPRPFTLPEIPDLAIAPSSTWQPLQQASSLIALDMVPAEKKQVPLADLRAEYLAIEQHDKPNPTLDPFAQSTNILEARDGVWNDIIM